jgi:hypothetical protein
MDAVMMSSAFLSALIISGSVVLLFSALIDGVLSRLVIREMAAAWTMFAKFALFVAALTGGLRLSDLESLLSSVQSKGAQIPLTSGKCLLEVFRAVSGALNGAVWMLLLIFGAALAFHLGGSLYSTVRSQRLARGETEPSASIAAGRHARSRESHES